MEEYVVITYDKHDVNLYYFDALDEAEEIVEKEKEHYWVNYVTIAKIVVEVK